MKTFIVTGAMGFLGRSFVDCLLREKHNVIVIVRDRKKAFDRWDNKVLIIERDLLTESGSISVKDLGENTGEKIFIHFAWNGTSGDKRASETTQLHNVQMSSELIRKAKDLGCTRFINAGSIMEYEVMKAVAADGKRPSGNSIYSIAKLTANLMMKTIAAEINIDYVNVIISNIYGPGEESGRFLNSILRAMAKNESVALTEGWQIYDFIYIDDAIRMIREVCERGKTFESYYIGNPEQRPLREFVIEAKEIMGSSSELLFGAVPFSGQALDYTEFDCKKMEELGVQPKISFAEGIGRMKAWLLGEKI